MFVGAAIQSSEHEQQSGLLAQSEVVDKDGVGVEDIGAVGVDLSGQGSLVQVRVLYLFSVDQFVLGDLVKIELVRAVLAGDSLLDIGEELRILDFIGFHLVHGKLLILPELNDLDETVVVMEEFWVQSQV